MLMIVSHDDVVDVNDDVVYCVAALDVSVAGTTGGVGGVGFGGDVVDTMRFGVGGVVGMWRSCGWWCVVCCW